MAKVCELCGKSTASGQRIRHHHAEGWMFRAPRTKRTWKPNMRKAKLTVDGKDKSVFVCMNCYKKAAKSA